MKIADIFKAFRIAHRAHDERGYSIPVAVPRVGGAPRFASVSQVRFLLLGHWGMRAVCGGLQ